MNLHFYQRRFLPVQQHIERIVTEELPKPNLFTMFAKRFSPVLVISASLSISVFIYNAESKLDLKLTNQAFSAYKPVNESRILTNHLHSKTYLQTVASYPIAKKFIGVETDLFCNFRYF